MTTCEAKDVDKIGDESSVNESYAPETTLKFSTSCDEVTASIGDQPFNADVKVAKCKEGKPRSGKVLKRKNTPATLPTMVRLTGEH